MVARGEGLEETSVDPNDGVAVERGMGRLGAEMANKGPRDTDPEKIESVTRKITGRSIR